MLACMHPHTYEHRDTVYIQEKKEEERTEFRSRVRVCRDDRRR